MIIITVQLDETNSARVELQGHNLIIDPRPVGLEDKYEQFHCTIERNILTVVVREGWHCFLKFRLYNPEVEKVPDFKSKLYTYYGLEGEYAPQDTVEAIIHPSARVIKAYAFSYCKKLKKCTMADGLEEIAQKAFYYCVSLKSIKLSRNLRCIGPGAFFHCKNVMGLFLPPSVYVVCAKAFYGCKRMRILALHEGILNLDDVADGIIATTNVLPLRLRNRWLSTPLLFDDEASVTDEVHDWLESHLDSTPLFKICSDTDVSATRIEEVLGDEHQKKSYAYQTNHHGMTPLHVLVMNPHATLNAIQLCYAANPSAAITPDGEGLTPLDYMWEYNNVEGIISIIHSLTIHREMYRGGVTFNTRKRRREDDIPLSVDS